MPRKGHVAKRDVLPDPLYTSKLVTRLINKIMVDGKRGTAQTILYTAFKKIEQKSGTPAMDVFATAINNIMPEVELKARRVGASNLQVPI
jgi:small subunit ribosomal protein S7